MLERSFVGKRPAESQHSPTAPILRPLLQGDVDTSRMSPWLLRIEMARDMMVDKKLLLSEVAERINRCRRRCCCASCCSPSPVLLHLGISCREATCL